MKTVNVLSIDAWAYGSEEERGWNWNNWFKVGTVDLDDVPISEEGKLQWFVSQGYASERALRECYIDDDQYNYVLTVTATGEPLFAIAYGEAYD
mgnify:CR=1 FL=1